MSLYFTFPGPTKQNRLDFGYHKIYLKYDVHYLSKYVSNMTVIHSISKLQEKC